MFSPPRVYVERTVQNPTYDIEEGQPSAIADTSDEAKEPIELYEEIPAENGTNDLDKFNDNGVYDVPEALENDQLGAYANTADVHIPGGEMFEAYATTDVSGEEMFAAYATTDVSGGDMLNAYAVTDISQTEGQCKAYAVTDVPEGRLGSGSQKVVSVEVHETKVKANAGPQTTPQRNADTTKDTARVKTPGVQLTKPTTSQKDTNGNKDRARVKAAIVPPGNQQQKGGRKTTNKAKSKSTKPALHPKPSGAETSKKVKFEDEDRRRSKSYTGTPWETVVQEEQTSTRSSVRGKPKPLPKRKGLMRNRGASDSGVEGYSKLDLKSQYASLEPHRNQESNAKDAKDAKIPHDSYSHLKH